MIPWEHVGNNVKIINVKLTYLTINKEMDMRNEIRHEALGILIEEELRRAGVNIAAMCDEMHMGHTTYSDLKGASINI